MKIKRVLLYFIYFIAVSSVLEAKCCIQVASVNQIQSLYRLRKAENGILKKEPYVRIERLSGFFVLRVGNFNNRLEAKPTFERVKKIFPDAYMRECEYHYGRIVHFSKKNKAIAIKPPTIEMVEESTSNVSRAKSIKTAHLISKFEYLKINKPVSLDEVSLASKKNHISFASTKIYKIDDKPKLDEPKVLEPYKIPRLRKTDESQIYDVLGFRQYINTLLRSNGKSEEIFYQKKIDYILTEIKKDRYNFDVYANSYVRTGTSISAQSGAPNVNGDYTGAGVALHANKLLYDGSYNLINHTYDVLYKRLADINELNVKDKLLIFGTSIYSNLYISQEALKIYKKIYKKQKDIVKFIQKGYNQGKSSPLDYMDSKNDLLNLQRLILNIKYQYLNNDYILRHSIESKSEKPYKLYPEKVKLNLDSLVLLQKEAVSHSSAVAQESNLLKIKQADLLYQKRRYIPKINFNSYVGYGLSTSRIFNLGNPGRGTYWELGLNFKLPIYNRNDINLSEEKERLKILKQKATLSLKLRDILIQVEKAYNEIMRTEKQIEILNEQLSLVKHKLEIAKKRYFIGVSPYRSYSDAVKGFLSYEVQLLDVKEKRKQEISILSILIGKRDFYE